jgi:hypothetical protein
MTAATPKFGVQYQPLSRTIDAGRLGTASDRTIFRDKSDVTGYAIWAVAQWLVAHFDGDPYEIWQDVNSDNGYRLTVEKLGRPSN